MMNKKTRAVTLIEVIIGIVLSALIIIGVLNIFSSGLKGSTKGLAHQANMETASILMAQIEYDLLRATSIKSPDKNSSDDAASWRFYYAASGQGYPVTVTYSKGSDGIIRNVVDDKDNKTISNNVFAKGHDTKIKFLHLKTVSSKEKRTGEIETFTLNRLIMIRNQY